MHPEWELLWDARTNAPAILYGDGIQLVTPSVHIPAAYETAARAFLAENVEMLGVGLADLHLRSAVRGPKTWYVDFERTYAGLPVIGAGISLRLQDGKLVLVRSRLHPELSVPTQPIVTADAARAAARGDLVDQGWTGVTSLAGERLVILPFEPDGDKSIQYRLAWEVRTAAERRTGPGRFDDYVDALSGEVLHHENEILYATATDLTVEGTYEPRLVGDPVQTARFMHMGMSAPFTDGNGIATLNVDVSQSVSLAFRGPYIRLDHVSNGNAMENVTVMEGVDQTFQWSDANSTLTERDVFQSHHRAKVRFEQSTPDLQWVNSQIPHNVGIDSECNAYWDGAGNFFQDSEMCNDTGRIADVVYHELGHGYHLNLMAGGIFDGSVSEGSSDYISATITGDPRIAPTFFKNGGWLRRLDSLRRYPDDLTGQVHNDGLIWGGAWWDLRELLIGQYGPVVGVETADRLHADTLRGGPTLVEGYWEALVADDDDADLSNGTRHVCVINQAFGAHGLGPGPGPGIAFALDPLGIQLPDKPVTIRADVFARFPQCGSLDTESVSLHWREDGTSAFHEVDMLQGADGLFEAEIPGVPEGTKIEYYFEAGNGSARRKDPADAPKKYYEYYSGVLMTVFFDDFETANEAGWTHAFSRAPSDPDSQQYADDWQLGEPQGKDGDPDYAFSGTQVWGNDLGWGEYNGTYRPNVTNQLISPRIDCRGFRGTRLQFRRWLTVEDALYDKARVRVNGQTVWYNAEGGGTEHHRDTNWHFFDIDIAQYADKKVIQIEFELASDSGLQMGGWNLDDVHVVATHTGPYPEEGCQCSLTNNEPQPARGAGVLLGLLALAAVLRRRR